MSNKQLPPELVEKMIPHVDLYKTKRERAEKCAKIAVDYADEQIIDIIRMIAHYYASLTSIEFENKLTETLKLLRNETL